MAKTLRMMGMSVAIMMIAGCTTNERTLAGAGIGGAGGALVGNAVGGTDGAIIGAVAGGVGGALIGRSTSDQLYHRRYSDRRYEQSRRYDNRRYDRRDDRRYSRY